MGAPWLQAVEERLDRLGHALMGPRVWPATLVGVSVLVVVASWLFVPGADESVALLGRVSVFSATCPVLEQSGMPCGQCGMTRSWVWAARGALPTAWAYSPAGLLAWLWLVGGGVLGGARLATKRYDLVRLGWGALAAAAGCWVAVYAVAHQLRLNGLLPLP